ncbi:MAG: tol-pal system-associated acyl-CoA thioesterase [Gammaproteobacteria bacterium]|nr:tol-pal system-associated acyl-CoA thioesterase [Gammaproteobacteria bacterium]
MSFQFPVRIYYEDTDAGGVVYHANYLNFYERCRTEYLRNLGFDQEQLLKDNIAFVVRRCEIDYLLPARFNDLLSVTVTVTGNRRTSVTFEQQIFSQTGKLLSTAVVVVVCVAIDQMKPTAIPQHILKEFMSDC